MSDLKKYANQTLSLIDLTSLNDNDDDSAITTLCSKTQTIFGSVPAVCIYSRYIPLARSLLEKINPQVRIATVANFPHGSSDLELALFETKLALERGANEVDIVFPYHSLKAGDKVAGQKMISKAKELCGNKTLKVIIESGELKTAALIKLASEISIDAGADFIKTSTGKVTVNATLEASEIMLNCIRNSGRKCGFKAAGGIRDVTEAQKYLELATEIMGDSWLTADNFRFGASGLLNDVLNILSNNAPDNVDMSVY